MTRRQAHWSLWIALVLLAPLPVTTGIVTGLMPVARMLLLTGACVLVMVLETRQGVVGTFTALLGGQALGWAVALWLAAWLPARALARLRTGRTVLGVLVAAALVLAATMPIYRTPFRADSVRSTWLEVFE